MTASPLATQVVSTVASVSETAPLAHPAEPGARQPPRRACLVVPASAPGMLAKAAARGADEVVVDLEDAVVPEGKPMALRVAMDALRDLDWSGVTVAARVNAVGSQWCHAEVAALAGAPAALTSIVVPKVETPEDLAFVARLLDGAEAAAGTHRRLRLQALVETAVGLMRVNEIAAASSRLEALVLGYADLATSLGRGIAGAERAPLWDSAREGLLVAARANGLQAIDGPHLTLSPDVAFGAAVARARDQGLDGKWAIHPAQLAPLVEAFTPTEDEVAHARAVVEALAAAERDGGQGAVALDGRMLDEAVRASALRVLARAGDGRRR